jgi:dipeptidyl aminopeptidase/acylaminoacyl peptidase
MRQVAAAVLLSAFVVPSAAWAAPERHRFGLDDLARLRDVSDPQISPEGTWVAYVVSSVDRERDEETGDIWMTSWDGERHVQLTTSKEGDSHPRFSPDGRYLAFLSARGAEEAESQVWVLDRGAARRAAHRIEGG